MTHTYIRICCNDNKKSKLLAFAAFLNLASIGTKGFKVFQVSGAHKMPVPNMLISLRGFPWFVPSCLDFRKYSMACICNRIWGEPFVLNHLNTVVGGSGVQMFKSRLCLCRKCYTACICNRIQRERFVQEHLNVIVGD